MMDNEIEDIVGNVKYTDSQKSVATSNMYSMDFTDSSSDKNNSSGKETYVIDCDDSDDSDNPFRLHKNESVINLKNYFVTPVIEYEAAHKPITNISKETSTSNHNYSIIAQETFTQTSKTIIELAGTCDAVKKVTDNRTMETQTSFISITENKRIEYQIEVSGDHSNFIRNEIAKDNCNNYFDSVKNCDKIIYNHDQFTPLEDRSSKFRQSETENEKSDTSGGSSDDIIINIIEYDSKENVLNEEQNEGQYENTSDFEVFSKSDYDIEEDSLNEPNYQQHKIDNSNDNSDTSEVPKSVDNDVEELLTKLSQTLDIYIPDRSDEFNIGRFGTLTPLTEESIIKKESITDITPSFETDTKLNENKDVIFTNSNGINVKIFPRDNEISGNMMFKLPPIQNNQSAADSPQLDFLFKINNVNKPLTKTGITHCRVESERERLLDRWEIRTKELASGESSLISGRSDRFKKSNNKLQLPPIYNESHISNLDSMRDSQTFSYTTRLETTTSDTRETISIKEKIKDLKMSGKNNKSWLQAKYNSQIPVSRSVSPCSACSPGETKLCEAAERGCDSLCSELLRRLRSTTWFEVVNTLEELPMVLDKFWGAITENRIADLIRQVSSHVESPRTQVARSACNTLASVLKSTNYTKKPDFYEAVTILLTKTGSFSRPVRRAANVALDDVVCGVEVTHAVTAVCIHGVSHKSGLVRCASARLLVVCAAMAGGGRELLRTRPATAACARRHALQALAALLGDRNADTRKYAERLYSMLRPLPNFEAYYLTDVDVELASKQMKKYDKILLVKTPAESR